MSKEVLGNIMLIRISCIQKLAKVVYTLHYFFMCAYFDECCR